MPQTPPTGELVAGDHELVGLITGGDYCFTADLAEGASIKLQHYNHLEGQYEDSGISPSFRDSFYFPGRMQVVVTAPTGTPADTAVAHIHIYRVARVTN